MGWDSSNRRMRLPSDWRQIRMTVFRRDGFRCQLRWIGCTKKATEVDHIVPGDDHRKENLQAVCSSCHSQKSSQEGSDAKARRKRAVLRKPETHPGRRKRNVTPGGSL